MEDDDRDEGLAVVDKVSWVAAAAVKAETRSRSCVSFETC